MKKVGKKIVIMGKSQLYPVANSQNVTMYALYSHLW